MRDFVIKNGHVIDPSLQINQVTDIYVENGRISAIGIPPEGPLQCLWSPVDASGCIVTPGLVDCHVHAYEHVTPLGVNIDQTCLAKGVTSVVDAGSAGSATFPGLRKFIAERNKCRLFSFLHIANHGLASAGCVSHGSGGECDAISALRVEDCVKTINDNRDMIVGVKVRLAIDITDNGRNEKEVYKRALQAASSCQVPLMVHHAMSSIEHGGKLGCPGDLGPGDIYTHCFHCHQSSIIDKETGRVDQYCWDAKNRGVLFDVGHGQGSFSWDIAKQAASEYFWPDLISTDLHTGSLEGPAYDLPCVMTKMLHLGMPLEEVIAAVTSRPAKAIGKLGEIGQLGIGMPADITIFKLEDISENLEDSSGNAQTVKKAFLPIAVFIGGEEFPVVPERTWPNPASAAVCRERMTKSNEGVEEIP